jgi:hypothetical protein
MVQLASANAVFCISQRITVLTIFADQVVATFCRSANGNNDQSWGFSVESISAPERRLIFLLNPKDDALH